MRQLLYYIVSLCKLENKISYRLILLYIYTIYSRYNTDWIANMEIGLDPNDSVIKSLWDLIHRLYPRCRQPD